MKDLSALLEISDREYNHLLGVRIRLSATKNCTDGHRSLRVEDYGKAI